MVDPGHVAKSELNRSLSGSRLAREITQGQLNLRGDGLVRFFFALVMDDQPVGVYGVRSYDEGKIRAIRAWNNSRECWDPFTKAYVPCAGKQFHRATSDTVFFLVEFDALYHTLVDKVAFKASSVLALDAHLPVNPAQADLRFEQIDLEGIQILG